MNSLFRNLLCAVLLAISGTAFAAPAGFTLYDSWQPNENSWKEVWQNSTSHSIYITLRWADGNDNDGDTNVSTWSYGVSPGDTVEIWDVRYSDGTYHNQNFIINSPEITSASTKTVTQGQSTSYTITATYNPNSFNATGLPPGLTLGSSGVISGTPTTPGTYASTISATNGDGTGMTTLTWTIVAVPDSTPPSTPTGLQSNSVSYFSFSLVWSPTPDNVGVTAYEVRRDGTLVGSPTTPGFSLTGLTQGTTYAMTVRARDWAGNWSPWSTPLSVVTASDSLAPSVPAGLTAASLNSSSFTLQWTPSTDNGGVALYEVTRDGVSVGTVTTASKAFSGLLPLTATTLTVRAKDIAGNWSAWSNPLTVTTPNVSAALTPSGYYTISGNYGGERSGWGRDYYNGTSYTIGVTLEIKSRHQDDEEDVS